MIVVKLAGGLANKMFQFAFYFALSKKRENVCIDDTTFQANYSFERNSLKNVFSKIDYPVLKNTLFRLSPKTDLTSRIIRKISRNYYNEKKLIYYPNVINSIPNKCYLSGFWQTEKYFKEFEKDIKELFKFPDFDEKLNIELSEKLTKENSVAIHIRKGKDYFENGGLTFGTCPIEYYNEAIQLIVKEIPNPVFYIFTDNPDWVKLNIREITYLLVDWNSKSDDKNFRDMQLMSLAKHNIIANSSFSWWAAWLNNNNNKIVIAPKIWFNPLKVDKTPDIIPESWIKI